MKNNLLQKNIPKGWTNSTIGTMCNVDYGTRVVKSRIIPGIYDVYGGGGKTFSLNEFNRENCVIVSRFAMSANCVRKISEKFFLNDSGLSLSVVDTSKIVQDYVNYFLLANQKVIYSLGRGAAQKNLNIDDFKKIDILVPSVNEQKKIANILSSVDEEIQKVDELISKTEKIKKSLTVKLFNESNVKKNINFSDLVSLSKSKIDPKNSSEEKYIGLEHIEQETSRLIGVGSSLDTTSIKSSFKKGDILFGKLRPYLRKYWKAEFDGVCTTEIFVFEPKDKEDADFILQIVQSEGFIEHSNSKSFGTKMPRTDWKIVSTFKVPDFSTEEKRKIGIILSEIDRKNLIHRKLKEKLILLKKGLMSDLLSGKVRVIK